MRLQLVRARVKVVSDSVSLPSELVHLWINGVGFSGPRSTHEDGWRVSGYAMTLAAECFRWNGRPKERYRTAPKKKALQGTYLRESQPLFAAAFFFS